MSARRPALLVDVDGVLNPFGDTLSRPPGFRPHRLRPRGFEDAPLRVWLNPAHGAKLLGMRDVVDLVWATTWEDQANTMIGPRIGITAPLPHIVLGEPVLRHNRIWKRDRVGEWAGTRPLAWIDDDFRGGDDSWAVSRSAEVAPTLLVHADPAVGLLDEHLARVREWVADVARS